MAGRTIILIDDDAVVRSAVRRMLERAGYGVREAADGRTGVALQQSDPADLVITDLFMAEQDGIETIQQLRDRWPALPIIAVSGGASVAAKGPLTDARLFGADATLSKPLLPEELLAVVRGLIGGA